VAGAERLPPEPRGAHRRESNRWRVERRQSRSSRFQIASQFRQPGTAIYEFSRTNLLKRFFELRLLLGRKPVTFVSGCEDGDACPVRKICRDANCTTTDFACDYFHNAILARMPAAHDAEVMAAGLC
jgi:hypothetical protein